MVTLFDERIMPMRLKHNLGFLSLTAVYASTEIYNLEEKNIFYIKFESIIDQCPPRDTLIVLGDFNAITGTDRAGYEVYIGPHGSGSKKSDISLLVNFAESRRLRIYDSWYQRRI
ncbi:uncharacterized protein LOC143019012 [Oratosquilla oratoria]|uniref:uncharacterized protein LOC143019012 n=1 Tax=Oratosquilla oratoria TaxID=337810 RepID=UPI003F76FEDC